MRSISGWTCSLVGLAFGLLLGVVPAARGGPIGIADDTDDGIGPGSAFERGVSGAKVVAGEDAIDVGNPGKTMGKSAAVNSGDAEGPTATMFCPTGGGTFGVLGALVRTAPALDEGRLDHRASLGWWSHCGLGFDFVALDEPDPAEPPVICVSSLSG